VNGIAAAAADTHHPDLRAEPPFGIERQPEFLRVFAAGFALPHIQASM
jgi:hypothetical protein